jgi:hypothetical protein
MNTSRRKPHAAALLSLLLLTSVGCSPLLGGRGASMRDIESHSDDAVIANLDKARAAAKASPGDVDKARVLAQNVAGVLQTGVAKRRHLALKPLLDEAGAALDAAAAAHADKKPEIYFSKGGMLLLAGDKEDGIAALRASMQAKASPRACVALIDELDKQHASKSEIVELCQAARANAASDETRLELLDACYRHSHEKSIDDGLKWAGAKDIAFYKDTVRRERARVKAEQDARAQAELRQAESAPPRNERTDRVGQKPPGGPTGFSLSLKNNCSKTVNLFLGRDPKFGSGTRTSLGSNTISSYSGGPGDMIWLVDEHDNGISSISPTGNQTMQILPSCSGFGAY